MQVGARGAAIVSLVSAATDPAAEALCEAGNAIVLAALLLDL